MEDDSVAIEQNIGSTTEINQMCPAHCQAAMAMSETKPALIQITEHSV